MEACLDSDMHEASLCNNGLNTQQLIHTPVHTFPAGLGTWYLMLRKASVNGVNEREELGFWPPASASASATAAASLTSPGASSTEAASWGAAWR